MVRSRKFLLLVLALVFPALIFTLHARTGTYLGDTDRFYHFALSRELAQKHAFRLESVPQVEDLGWGTYFPDKEFLFHVLTSVGYRIGGESGADTATLLVASGAGAALFLIGLGSVEWITAFFSALAVFCTHSLIFRMLFLRPHVLAIFLFLLVNAGLLRRNAWLTALASLFYALAYHAFYVPPLCFALFAAASYREAPEERRRNLFLCAAGLAGTAIGVLVNPYFPSNFYLGLQHAQIPFLMQGALKGAGFGMELFPLNGPSLLKFYYFPFGVTLVALISGLFALTNGRYLCALACLFGLLSFATVRAGEYFIPAAGLLFPLLLARLPHRRSVAAACAGAQLLALAYLAKTEASFVPDGALYDSIRAAVREIPPGPDKILNCEWDSSPFLFHARPDLRFVDTLDPTFLYFARPNLFYARRDFSAGRIADAFSLARAAFHADYVLCRNPLVVSQLEADPDFRRIYPRGDESRAVALFRVMPEGTQAFVREISFTQLPDDVSKQPRGYRPGTEKLNPAALAGFDRAWLFPHTAVPVCFRASVAAGEVARLIGARYMGLGGAGALRAWRNGRLLFSGGPEFAHARSVQALVRLDPPLARGDAIDVLVCTSQPEPAAVAVSFWSDERLGTLCREKRESYQGKEEEEGAPFSAFRNTCLGIMAAPSVPRELR